MTVSRRQFLATSGSCVAHLTLAGALLPPLLRARWNVAAGRVVAAEPFARIEAVAPGVWAVISTPLNGDFTTVCNGGLIAGKNGVLAIEGFMQPAGAKWLAEQSKTLTGRWPTHVLVTHYHSDHANGVSGYGDGGPAPRIHATAATRTQVNERNKPADASREHALADAVLVDAAKDAALDIGGRKVKLLPRSGHTSSDTAIVVDEANLVFGGDLLWNGMFPNYVDATPTTLAKSVAGLRRSGEATYVPGHGPIAKQADLDRYQAFLQEIERAAREAHGKGLTTAEAAQAYSVPASLGEWTLFNKSFIETALKAWYKELG